MVRVPESGAVDLTNIIMSSYIILVNFTRSEIICRLRCEYVDLTSTGREYLNLASAAVDCPCPCTLLCARDFGAVVRGHFH